MYRLYSFFYVLAKHTVKMKFMWSSSSCWEEVALYWCKSSAFIRSKPHCCQTRWFRRAAYRTSSKAFLYCDSLVQSEHLSPTSSASTQEASETSGVSTSSWQRHWFHLLFLKGHMVLHRAKTTCFQAAPSQTTAKHRIRKSIAWNRLRQNKPPKNRKFSGPKKEVISILKNARFKGSGAKSWPWLGFF